MKTTPCNSPLCGVFQGCRCWAGLSLLPPMVAFHGASCQPQSPRLSSLTLLLPPPIRVCFQPLSSFRKELALCYFILNLSSSASLLCVCEMHRSLPLQNHLHMLFYENLSYWLPLHPLFQNCPVTSSVTWVIIFWHLGLLTCKICSWSPGVQWGAKAGDTDADFLPGSVSGAPVFNTFVVLPAWLLSADAASALSYPLNYLHWSSVSSLIKKSKGLLP